MLRIGILTFFVLITACKFDKSVSKNFNTSISTEGDGLSAGEVYLSTDAERLDDNVFVYGQKIYTNFENMDGFVIENDKYYAKMGVEVISESGEVVMQSNNLLDSSAGLDASLRTLFGELILAQPMHSGAKYTASYDISDERGEGTFTSTMDFEILPNPNITVKESGLKAQEIYIFNTDSKSVITNSETQFGDNLQFQFEGLEGYTLVDGFVALGLSIKVEDARGKQILYNKNAFENTLITEAQIAQGVGGTLVFSKGMINNPVTWEVEIWDVNSDARLKGTTQLKVN